jgi:hypothetical protein
MKAEKLRVLTCDSQMTRLWEPFRGSEIVLKLTEGPKNKPVSCFSGDRPESIKGVAMIFAALRHKVLKCAQSAHEFLTTPPSRSNHTHLECPAAMIMIEQAFSRVYQRAQVNQVTR